ncbi:hypothetical protein [Mycolicibacterium gadium]|uniref:hypothetical protein n=1 Tax=Mycolicibacterium gadium TaxID=1794 RepID=UPI0013D5CF8B|nr:hypothetical protein [Mycolicibacterium gadium]
MWFANGWMVVREGVSQILGEFLSDWDYMSSLHLVAEVEINTHATRNSTHQGDSARFALVVTAASSSTRLRGPVWQTTIPAVDSSTFTVDIELAGYELGGRLDLSTSLTLIEPDPTDAIGASERGAILWRSVYSVALEGDATQFPTESADLSKYPYNSPATAWRLEADTDDLDAIAAAAIRLLVNHTHPVMAAALDGVDSREVSIAIHAMRWDVTRQLINLALDNSEFIERHGSFDEDTLGWTLSNIVRTHFPDETPSSLRTMRQALPSAFEAALQNASRILG